MGPCHGGSNTDPALPSRFIGKAEESQAAGGAIWGHPERIHPIGRAIWKEQLQAAPVPKGLVMIWASAAALGWHVGALG